MAFGYVVSTPFGGHGVGDLLTSVDAENERNVVRFQLADMPPPVPPVVVTSSAVADLTPLHAPIESPEHIAAHDAVEAAKSALAAAEAAETAQES
jgi:hypothetical protein